MRQDSTKARFVHSICATKDKTLGISIHDMDYPLIIEMKIAEKNGKR
jgi:hypothetical protein